MAILSPRPNGGRKLGNPAGVVTAGQTDRAALLDAQDRFERLQTADPEAWEALELYLFGQRTLYEVAARLGCSPSQVGKLVKRGEERMRAMEEDGGEAVER